MVGLQGLLGLVDEEEGIVELVDEADGFVRVVWPNAKPGTNARAAIATRMACIFSRMPKRISGRSFRGVKSSPGNSTYFFDASKISNPIWQLSKD